MGDDSMLRCFGSQCIGFISLWISGQEGALRLLGVSAVTGFVVLLKHNILIKCANIQLLIVLSSVKIIGKNHLGMQPFVKCRTNLLPI